MNNQRFDNLFAITIATLFSAIGVLIFNAMPVFLGAVADSLGFDNRQLGMMASVYIFGSAITALTAFLWIRRFNCKRTALVASILAAAGCFAASIMETYLPLLVALMLIGTGAGSLFVISMTRIAEFQNTKRSFGMASFAQLALGALATLTLPVFVTPRWGFSGVAIAFSLTFTLGIIMCRWLPMQATNNDHDRYLSHQRITLRPVVGLVGLLLFLIGVTAVWVFLERIGNSAGFSPEIVGTALSFSLISGGMGAIAPALIGHKYGRRLPIIIAGVIVVSSTIAVVAIKTTWGYFSGVFAFMCAWAFGTVYKQSTIAECDTTGRASPMIPAVMLFGAAIGPGIAGTLLSESYAPLFFVIVTTTGFAIALFYWATQSEFTKA